MYQQSRQRIKYIMIGIMSDQEILEELGRRLRAYRLLRNLGAAEVAERAGLNRNTVVNAEAGANPQLGTVVKMLRVLERLDALDAFLTPPGISPMQMIKTAGRQRMRARRRPRG
jgi:transcriptional regulator with XRE-family HTH domain